MSRRQRTIWTLAVVAALLAVVELGLDFWRGPVATVEIENAATEPMDDLAVVWRGQRTAVGRIAPSASARVRVAGRGTGGLVVQFRQQGNAVGTIEVPGFSPEDLSGEGLRQVVRVRPNEVERFLDDADPSLAGRAWRGLYRGLGGTPDESLTPQ